MAYSIDALRCDAATKHGMRCVLGYRHAWHHVTVEGGHFAEPGSSYAFPWDATPPGDIRKADGPTSGATATADGEMVDGEIAVRVAGVARPSGVTLSEVLQRIGEVAQRLDIVDSQLAAEKKAREALSTELVNTRRGRLSPLEDRVVKLELPYGHVQAVKDTHNALVERIERIERDLRDTHELAERVATAHLERKPEAPVPDTFQRCDVSVPKQCVLQFGHGGHSHVSNSGTMWPVDDRRAFAGTAGEVRE